MQRGQSEKLFGHSLHPVPQSYQVNWMNSDHTFRSIAIANIY